MPVSISRFIKKAFATDGDRSAIPDASNNATGRAGYDKGFPQINMQPIEAGGIPPNGTDMNGVLYDVTLAISYIQSGKFFPFNSDFAIAIGGYGSGAVVSDASNSTLWVNGTVNNTAFPAGWTNFSLSDPTESIRGLPYSSSNSDALQGTSNAKMITPANLSYLNSQSGAISFISPGVYTFSVPDIVRASGKKVRVTVTGGGGGGGGGNSSINQTGGGGGAGGTSIRTFQMIGVSTVSVTVGSPGSGGLRGGNGGASSFGSYLSAGGGFGALGDFGGSGGVSAAGSGGDINLYGGWGSDGASVLTTGCGNGGASYWGGGGRSSQTPESHPSAFGAGGGGNSVGSGVGNQATGGAVYIEW